MWVCVAQDWTWGLRHARQVLYQKIFEWLDFLMLPEVWGIQWLRAGGSPITQYQNSLLFYNWIIGIPMVLENLIIVIPHGIIISLSSLQTWKLNSEISVHIHSTNVEQTLQFPYMKNKCNWAKLTFSREDTQTRRWQLFIPPPQKTKQSNCHLN